MSIIAPHAVPRWDYAGGNDLLLRPCSSTPTVRLRGEQGAQVSQGAPGGQSEPAAAVEFVYHPLRRCRRWLELGGGGE